MEWWWVWGSKRPPRALLGSRGAWDGTVGLGVQNWSEDVEGRWWLNGAGLGPRQPLTLYWGAERVGVVE